MGNNLCATWQKDYRGGCDWPPRKDAHLIRLWAEIFEVREENREILWGRVSDDVVPVNVVCVQDSPETVYEITAYNRLVEKIFDVYVTQPGTQIVQASDCFVHWRDAKCNREWGLNFTLPLDARRFRECCAKNVNLRIGSSEGSPLGPTRGPTKPPTTRQDNVLLPMHLHHAPDPQQQQLQQQQQQHCAGMLSAAAAAAGAAPHGAQRLQVRQVLSVYVDNRCRCGDRHHLGTDGGQQQQQQQQHRPQSFPMGSGGGGGLYGGGGGGLYAPLPQQRLDRHQDSHCRHCLAAQQQHAAAAQVVNYACHYAQQQQQQQQSIHHCHTAADDDNAINQSIYMSAKEARLQQQQMLLYAKNQSLMVVAAPRSSSSSSSSRDPVKDIGAAPPSGDAVAVAPTDAPQQKENSSATPREDEGAPANQSSSPSVGVELPASFDSVTLKRMLRSLSGSPLLDRTSVGGLSGSRSDDAAAAAAPNGLSQRQENAALKNLDSSFATQERLTEPFRLDHLRENKEPVAGTSETETVVDKGLDVGEETDAGSAEAKAPAQSRPVSEREDKSLPDGCVAESVEGVLSETLRSEGMPTQVKVTSDVSPNDGETSVEHSLDEFHEISTDNTTKRDNDGMKMTAAESSASKDAENIIQTDLVMGLHERLDSGSWVETPEIRRLTMSDLSGSECGSDGEGANVDRSSIFTVPSQIAFISPSMAMRKTGWLMAKNWLVHRKRSIELAAKRTWNKYWVCLRGNVLLFHVCDDGKEVTDDRAPKYRLVLEGALAQAVPEHPKKQNIFSLSTAFGDAYLLQTNDQADLSGWISAVHIACSASFFRQHGRENILKLLQNEIHRMESSIDLDLKMKKMATKHLTTVSDSQSRHAIDRQITQWEENLEKLYVEQYRLRCYVSSMKIADTPNPKTLLSFVSRNTKVVLGNVGVFTVNAFHALVCARSPLAVNSSAPNSHQKNCCLLSTFKSDSVVVAARTKASLRGVGFRPMLRLPGSEGAVTQSGPNHCNSPPSKTLSNSPESFVRVQIAGSQVVAMVEVNERTTVGDLMDVVCRKHNLKMADHFLRIKLPNSSSVKIPDKNVQICNEEYDLLEICTKLHFQIELARNGKDRDFGLRVAAELADDVDRPDALCILITEITRCGMAYRKGLVVGDEILVINGQAVTQLDMVFVENLLQEVPVACLTVRSCRIDRPPGVGPASALSDHVDLPGDCQAISPVASSSSSSSSAQVPRDVERLPVDTVAMAPASMKTDRPAEIPDLLRTKKSQNSTAEPIDGPGASRTSSHHVTTRTCRHQCLMKSVNANVADYMVTSSARPLSNSQRICKVILELIDTERLYVRDLMCLIERYLEPLKRETYLSCDDINQLFGNIQEIVQFQKLFLHSLEEAINADPDFNVTQEPDKSKDENLRQILIQMSSSFVYYAHHFKLYSSFCASHSKAQKMILSDDNIALHEFLKACNPKQQHSATLESYLIKPVQRIVKYPLLLKQLYELTDHHSKEHFHLREALHGMEAVAEHINEMQKIYEEYGTIFEELMRQHKQDQTHNKGVDLNVGELQMYGTVNWINATEELGKLKKSTDLLTLVFIFKSAIVLLAQERQKFKKKAKALVGRSAWGCEASESTRFKLAIPVEQLQVRTVVGDVNDRHGIWEVVHCDSEKERRPKKVYQFLSSHKARNDFIRTIHHMMHESVRRISVGGVKSQPTRLQTSAVHQRNQQRPFAVDANSTAPKDGNSKMADSATAAGQIPDNRNGCTRSGNAISPVRRGADFPTGAAEGKDHGLGCSISPGHRTRQHQRDPGAPPAEPSSLSPRQPVNNWK